MGLRELSDRSTPAVFYPESDGKPMAETDLHWDAIVELALLLEHRYRDDPRTYVASDNLIYYVEGDPKKRFSPDVYVVFGVPKRKRRIYKIWEEGRPPDVVFEISSRSTRRRDISVKMDICTGLGVTEYFLFDPEHDYLDPPIQGHRLHHGRYRPIEPDETGALASQTLDLILAVDGPRLAVYESGTRSRLLPADLRAEAAEQRAENAEAELERLRARLARLDEP